MAKGTDHSVNIHRVVFFIKESIAVFHYRPDSTDIPAVMNQRDGPSLFQIFLIPSCLFFVLPCWNLLNYETCMFHEIGKMNAVIID
ncbi:hypothetical protein [Anditalea andensis]|uniref:hypothetical protein n=1 Tax=Anditalea andensis TaxID=1048983 RepID=UPI0009FC5E5E|nr:hypothetical protein [Anditalea andensis]